MPAGAPPPAATPALSTGARPSGGRAKAYLAVLACAHCSLTLVAALGGLLFTGAAAPRVLGVGLDTLVIPLLMGSAFFGWLWWGKRAADRDEACRLPE